MLNSGTGELGWIERAEKAKDAKFHVVAFCPGFVRGLGFHGKYAFVGLSKPRYERFEGLALDKKLAETDFRAVVRRAGDRPQHRRLRTMVPPRWSRGRALRCRGGTGFTGGSGYRRIDAERE